MYRNKDPLGLFTREASHAKRVSNELGENRVPSPDNQQKKNNLCYVLRNFTYKELRRTFTRAGLAINQTSGSHGQSYRTTAKVGS